MALLDALAASFVRDLGRPAPHLSHPLRFAERVGFQPDSWQREVLTTRAAQIAMNIPRQCGKSTVAALVAVWTALTVTGATVLLVAPAMRQAKELFRKCRDAFTVRQLGGRGVLRGVSGERRGGGEDPWLCGPGFHRVCLSCRSHWRVAR